MCGRYSLKHPPPVLEEEFAAIGIEPFPPRYNIAPTQPILIIAPGLVPEPGSNRPQRVGQLVRWGFIPSWVKDVKAFPMLINARAETATDKASFRAAMRHRRVIVPASGFYEWKRVGKKVAQAYWIRPRHGGVIGFAGLMETYAEPGGSEMDTAAILTTGANSRIAQIHDRMPVVVRPEHYGRWLDCIRNEPRDVADIMEPVEPDFFEAIPVSDKVNKVANVGPDLQDEVPLAESEPETPAESAGGGQLSLF